MTLASGMQWERGRYHGLGTEIFAKGSTYHGEYDSGARHGPGVCHYYNGDYYEGFWQRGMRQSRLTWTRHASEYLVCF